MKELVLILFSTLFLSNCQQNVPTPNSAACGSVDISLNGVNLNYNQMSGMCSFNQVHILNGDIVTSVSNPFQLTFFSACQNNSGSLDFSVSFNLSNQNGQVIVNVNQPYSQLTPQQMDPNGNDPYLSGNYMPQSNCNTAGSYQTPDPNMNLRSQGTFEITVLDLTNNTISGTFSYVVWDYETITSGTPVSHSLLCTFIDVPFN